MDLAHVMNSYWGEFLTEDEKSNKAESVGMKFASNIIKSEKSPHGHIYFNFNDEKETYLGKGNAITEAPGSDAFLRLKKLVIGGAKLGAQHQKLVNK